MTGYLIGLVGTGIGPSAHALLSLSTGRRPLETALPVDARARGCRVLHGGGMVVLPAAESFRLFTGVEPDPARMLRHFDALEREAARTAHGGNGGVTTC